MNYHVAWTIVTWSNTCMIISGVVICVRWLYCQCMIIHVKKYCTTFWIPLHFRTRDASRWSTVFNGRRVCILMNIICRYMTSDSLQASLRPGLRSDSQTIAFRYRTRSMRSSLLDGGCYLAVMNSEFKELETQQRNRKWSFSAEWTERSVNWWSGCGTSLKCFPLQKNFFLISFFLFFFFPVTLNIKCCCQRNWKKKSGLKQENYSLKWEKL